MDNSLTTVSHPSDQVEKSYNPLENSPDDRYQSFNFNVDFVTELRQTFFLVRNNCTDYSLLSIFYQVSKPILSTIWLIATALSLFWIGVMFAVSAAYAMGKWDVALSPFSSSSVNVVLSAVYIWEVVRYLRDAFFLEWMQATVLQKMYLGLKSIAVGILALACVPPYASLGEASIRRAAPLGWPWVQVLIDYGVFAFHVSGVIPLADLMEELLSKAISPELFLLGFDVSNQHEKNQQCKQAIKTFIEHNFITYLKNSDTGPGWIVNLATNLGDLYSHQDITTREVFFNGINNNKFKSQTIDLIISAFKEHYQTLNSQDRSYSIPENTFSQLIKSIMNNFWVGFWFVLSVAGFIPYFRGMAKEPVGFLTKIFPWSFTVLCSTIVSSSLCMSAAETANAFFYAVYKAARSIYFALNGDAEQAKVERAESGIVFLMDSRIANRWLGLMGLGTCFAVMSASTTQNLSAENTTNTPAFEQLGPAVEWIFTIVAIYFATMIFNIKGLIDVSINFVVQFCYLASINPDLSSRDLDQNNISEDQSALLVSSQFPQATKNVLIKQILQRFMTGMDDLPSSKLQEFFVTDINLARTVKSPSERQDEEQGIDHADIGIDPDLKLTTQHALSVTLSSFHCLAMLGWFALETAMVLVAAKVIEPIFEVESYLDKLKFYAVLASIVFALQSIAVVVDNCCGLKSYSSKVLGDVAAIAKSSILSFVVGSMTDVVVLNLTMHYLIYDSSEDMLPPVVTGILGAAAAGVAFFSTVDCKSVNDESRQANQHGFIPVSSE